MQALKKLIRFSVKNSEQKFIFLHETNEFWIEKTVNMWVKVLFSSALDQDQDHYILIKLDSYFMMNLVSILFIESLNIFFCLWKKHQHIMLNLKNISEISFADALILFISWKSEELCLCVNYYKLNVIIIKNCYSLLLTNKLLD